ncbi:HAD hydrolase-like protein [Fictibacillus barbaricus]|uniref:Phosphoglycolate phosphatase n=1 Tax=Fictibacillus barbaricus TaxID=182136 RepID=A0ABU1U420_9BACL|nr:HAD hydrolase-like protein [Fictibacillus barbaricus]MDR7074222.1 phosphoglycolate phosphatase [Fictibacillus barbaricus]
MKSYKHVLFDLDGTLTDPKLGITQCVQYALSKFNIHVTDLRVLECFIGPPLDESFREYYGLDAAQSTKAVEFYRERFRSKGLYENEVIEGIHEMLTALKEDGVELHVATSKPTVFAEIILRHFKLDHFFVSIIGSNLDGTRSKKVDIIEHILLTQPQIDKDSVIMVGDRKHDIIGANLACVDSVGVTFGYGSEEELLGENPTYIVNNVSDLLDVLRLKEKAISRERDVFNENSISLRQRTRSIINKEPFKAIRKIFR